MSGLAAILDLHGAQPDPHALTPALLVLERRGPDGAGVIADGPVILGCARLETLPEDEPQPVVYGGVTVVADARLDNRPELEGRLGLPRTVSDAVLIAAAVTRWGAAAAERLEGDFAVLAWNGERLLAIRDRFGVRPLYYTRVATSLVIASELQALTAHPDVQLKPDRQYFLEQLAAQAMTTEKTPFAGIQRLPAGAVLAARPGAPLNVRRYYHLSLRPTVQPLDEAAETTRTLLDEAVRVRLRARGPLACDVSGGMDSTSVYASARAQGPDPVAVSIISDRWPTMDERRYSRPLVGDSPWIWVFAEAHAPVADAERAAASFDEPMQDVLFSVRLAIHQALPQDCRVVLSGHGGDGTMSGMQGLLHGLAARRRWLELYRQARLWADPRDIPLGGALARALRPWHLSAPALPWASSRVAREARDVARALTASIRQDGGHGPDAAVFLAFTETGLRQQPRDPVETRYPFLHRPLVEFALSTNPTLKARAGADKRVLRRAMQTRLPPAILDRSLKTGFTAAYSYGLLAHWHKAETWLAEPWLCELDILDARGFRRLAERLRDGRTGHDADTIYALVDEVWLRARLLSETATQPQQPPRRWEAGVRRLMTWRRVEGR